MKLQKGDLVKEKPNYSNGHLDSDTWYTVEEVWNNGECFRIEGIEKDEFHTRWFKKMGVVRRWLKGYRKNYPGLSIYICIGKYAGFHFEANIWEGIQIILGPISIAILFTDIEDLIVNLVAKTRVYIEATSDSSSVDGKDTNVSDNRDKDISISKDSERNSMVSRYKCPLCGEYQIIQFNSVVESNHNYCPMCGCKIIPKE